MTILEVYSRKYVSQDAGASLELDLWCARVSLTDPRVSIDDIFILQSHFTIASYLRVSKNAIDIEDAVSRAHVYDIGKEFNVYTQTLSLVKSLFLTNKPVLHWSDLDIQTWQYLAYSKAEHGG